MKGKKRGRPAADERMRADVSEKALSDKRPRKELAGELAKKYPYSELTIQKWISKARAHEPLPLDKPFTLGALVEYPIPPEALPMVLKVWQLCHVETKKESFHQDFTIRHALWVSRFARLFEDPENIWSVALWYSVRERAYEAIGKAIDTTTLDEQLLKNFKPTKSKQKPKREANK